MFYSVWITGANATEKEQRGIQVEASGISRAKAEATTYAEYEDKCKGNWKAELSGMRVPKYSGLHTRQLQSGKVLNLIKEDFS